MPRRVSWSEMTNPQRAAVLAVGVAESVLTVAAWVDLARRPASAVRGPKGVWALGALVQPVGPVAYFVWGRR